MIKQRNAYRLARAAMTIAYTALLIFGIIGKDFLIVIVLLASGLVAGAFYCGWLCPFGMVQEWLGRIGRMLKLPRLRIPDGIEKYLRFLRYALLGLSFTGLLFLYFLNSPYGTFMGSLTGNLGLITAGMWVIFALFLIASLIVDRPFCRYFCTEGARYGALSLGRLFTIRRNLESCINCKACDRACPTGVKIESRNHVRNAQCINCFECIAACPVTDTLKYGWAFKKQTTTEAQTASADKE